MNGLTLNSKRVLRSSSVGGGRGGSSGGGDDVESAGASTAGTSGFSLMSFASAPPPLRHAPSRAHQMARVVVRTLGLVLLLAIGLAVSGHLTQMPDRGSGPRWPVPPWWPSKRPSSSPTRTQSFTSPMHSYASDYTPATNFPTSAFASMHQFPSGTTIMPRPAIPNLVTSDAGYFPDQVAHPSFVPTGDVAEHAVLPLPSSTLRPPSSNNAKSVEDQFVRSIRAQVDSLISSNNQPACDRCQRALALGQQLARLYPTRVPEALGDLCATYQAQRLYGPGKPHATLAQAQQACYRTYAASTLGGTYTQVLSYAQLSNSTLAGSEDSQAICAHFLHACPPPAPRRYSREWLDQWFAASGASPTVPAKVQAREAARAQRHVARIARGEVDVVRVAHISDLHLDPRYSPQAEGACTSGQCCRVDSRNTSASNPHGSTYEPAGYYGAYKCDTPWSLIVAALQSVKQVLPPGTDLGMSLFTGDSVTHENAAPWHLTRDLLLYTQQAASDALSHWLGPAPVYSALGNHDSVPSDFVPVSALPDGRKEATQWEWDNVARLLRQTGTLTREHELDQVQRHQGGYSVLHTAANGAKDQPGLRIVVLNTDAWYVPNAFTYIKSSEPDGSGMLRFLTNVLTAAEQHGEKVWLVGHVLPAWSGTGGHPNPTQLVHAIIDRFAPHTLTGAFFGHTHEDQFSVVYPFNERLAPDSFTLHEGLANSTAHRAKLAMLMAPSITPGSNVNPAFRIYDVDHHTWEVLDYTQYYAQLADVSYNATAHQTNTQPPLVWRALYRARDAFGSFASSVQQATYSAPLRLHDQHQWPQGAPLNGTFWAAVTDEMRARPELVSLHTRLSSRLSPRSPVCTTTRCREAKICYMRAGDSAQGQACPQGYDSVQSGPDSYH